MPALRRLTLFPHRSERVALSMVVECARASPSPASRVSPGLIGSAIPLGSGCLLTPSGARWQERKLLSRVGDSREWAAEERARYPGLLPPPSGGRGIPASLTSNFHLEKRDAVAAPASPIGARPRRGTESPSFSAAVERGEIAVSAAAEQALGFKRSLRSERFYQKGGQPRG